MALKVEDFEAVSRTAMAVAVQCGKRKSTMAAEHVLLSQSCLVRGKLETVLCHASAPQAREHILLLQRRHLFRQLRATADSPLVKENTLSLQEASPAWPILQVRALCCFFVHSRNGPGGDTVWGACLTSSAPFPT
jgi:hypothetical protein